MKKAVSAAAGLISLFSLIAIRTFMHPCTGMMRMKCVTTADFATVAFIISFVTATVMFFLKNVKACKVSGVVLMITGICSALLPSLGSCKVSDMRCNTMTMPMIRTGGILVFITALACEIILAKRREQN